MSIPPFQVDQKMYKHFSATFFRPKHVSFARSHTLASFDDAVVSLSSTSSQSGRMTRSQERLLDVRKCPEPLPITKQPEPSDNILGLGEYTLAFRLSKLEKLFKQSIVFVNRKIQKSPYENPSHPNRSLLRTKNDTTTPASFEP